MLQSSNQSNAYYTWLEEQRNAADEGKQRNAAGDRDLFHCDSSFSMSGKK